MKYLRPRKKGAKIKVSPSQSISVDMFNVVRVEEKVDRMGNITDGHVTVMSVTGEEMLYQPKGQMFTKKRYIVEMLKDNRQFHITDNYNFININSCLN